MTTVHNLPPTTFVTPRPLRPGVAGYVVGAILFVSSFVLFFGVLFGSLFGAAIDLVPDAIPITGAQGEVMLEADADYVIYLPESGSRFDEPAPTIVGPDGDAVEVTGVTFDYTYTSDIEYRGTYSFTTTEAGNYEITRNVDAQPEQIIVTRAMFDGVGSGFGSRLKWAFISATLLGVSGLALMVVTAIRRSSDKKKRDSDRSYPGGQSYPVAPPTGLPSHANPPTGPQIGR